MNTLPATRPLVLNDAAAAWIARVFDAKSVERGGVVRRSIASVERELGRTAFAQEVRRRGFHLIECGDQFIVICNPGRLQIVV